MSPSILAAFLLLVLLLVDGPPATAHDRGGSVFVLSQDGGSPRRVSVVDSTDMPCWTPDGRGVLYAAHTSRENAFHLVSTARVLLLNIPIRSPFISVAGVSAKPGGAEIAFGSEMETGRWDIFRMGLAAANGPELMVPDGIFPAWSPDGQHFAFTTYRTGDMELFLADQTGKNFRNLTNHPAYDARATWSPDGRRLAFESDRYGNIEICALEVETGVVTRMTNHPGEDREPAWSRNGEIAFASNREGLFSIYRMAQDGTAVTRLTMGSQDRQPAWAPAGDSLCFVSVPNR